ncbi:cytochrome b/b6 domain-containing protein [Photobacterium atrarenae]|uniref:Cytochrome b/b6 domain-containing protein n=1 Tax=Photobacterium atrarenae TaxID=865757 RepID=A0ABY5GLM3_9GAMM|nr:cytochrome b/b6 domain-containing protein [Photobacterium atrarenae]UTV30215.1 cytochrome b/b6 domain-containing protein [Photobacterium atrarenae]
MTTPTPIWDSFVRGYHWLQALSVVGLWYTGTEGLMDWHFAIAYLLLALLLTRLLWGFIGSETARFRHFVHMPGKVLHYLRSMHHRESEHQPVVGHNPAGGYMVITFFLLLTIQLTTGLFANDDILSEGPFALYVSADTSSFLTQIHALNFNLILTAIGLHLGAIALYQLKKENLIKPMILGTKPLPEALAPKIRNGLLAWVIFAAVGGLIYVYFAQDIIPYLL